MLYYIIQLYHPAILPSNVTEVWQSGCLAAELPLSLL